MEWVETTGKTVAEAKSIALDRLGVDEANAEFEVVEEATSKLLGLKRTDARVRARVRPTTPRAKTEHRGRKSGGRSRSRSKRGGGQDSSKAGSRDDERDAPKPAAADDQRAEATTDREDAAPKAPKKQARRSEGQDRPKAPVATTEKDENMQDEVTLPEQATMVEEFLTGLLDAFELDGGCERLEGDEDTIEVNVTGDELGLLIGPRGRTLSALNELSRTVVQRQAAGASVAGRVFIDVSSYRERRREALTEFVQNEAAALIEDGRERSFEPMSAADRKTVHDAVADLDGVTSRSVGEEPRRRVVIAKD